MSISMMERAVRSADEEAAAVYLAGVGPIVAEGSAARQALVNGLAALRETGAVEGGAALAEQQGEAFRVLRQRLGRLVLPRMCGRCHAAVTRWLELHEAACLTLIAGGPKALVKAAQLIADGQGPAQEFTAEYTRLARLVGTPSATEPVAERAVETRAPAPAAPVVEDDLEAAVEESLQAALDADMATSTPDPRAQLNETARRNGDAAWTALAVVAQARGHHPTGTLGAWLGAVEGVLAASAALTALIIAAETVVLD